MKKIKIGVIGSSNYEKASKIKETIFNLKKRFHDNELLIIGRGNPIGAEKYVKRYALQFGIEYKELNPSHTSKNVYSLMTEGFYNREYSPRNFIFRDMIFSKYVDTCICFASSNYSKTDKTILNCLNSLDKLGKKRVLID